MMTPVDQHKAAPVLRFTISGEWSADDMRSLLSTCNIMYNTFMMTSYATGVITPDIVDLLPNRLAVTSESLEAMSAQLDRNLYAKSSLPRLRIHRLRFASPGVIELAGMAGALIPVSLLLNKAFELYLKWGAQTHRIKASRVREHLQNLNTVIDLCERLHLSEEATRRVLFGFDEQLAIFGDLVDRGGISQVDNPSAEDGEDDEEG